MRCLNCLLVACLLFAASAVEAQKLYRWTDKEGKVHYSDHVPPEAIENARDELNKSGMKVKEVERALTPEELEAAKVQRDAEAAQREAEAKQAEKDNILLSSYGNVGELERAYAERFDLIEQSVESARIGVASQEKSLADLLAHAAGLERQGKPVPATIQSSIELARKQVGEQRSYMDRREAEKKALNDEFEATKAHYLSLKARKEAPAESD